MRSEAWPILRWMLRAQMLLTLAAAALTGWLMGWDDGAFALLGGLGALGLTIVVALRAFSVDAAADPKAAFGALARGETLKLVLAMALFVAVAVLVPERFGPVLIGFCAATASYWLALAFADRAGSRRETTD